MKYKIELYVRGKGVQLMKVTPEEQKELLEQGLEDAYVDWVSDHDYDFYHEEQYLTYECDRFRLLVKDEDGNDVYDIDDPELLLDQTYDEDGLAQVKGWEFVGIDDGDYLTRIQTIKGCCYEAEIELDEPFDSSKLYLVQDEFIDDELMGDYTFPLDRLYYQRGKGYDKERDEIELEFIDDMGEQYYDTAIFKVTHGNCWDVILEQDDEE